MGGTELSGFRGRAGREMHIDAIVPLLSSPRTQPAGACGHQV